MHSRKCGWRRARRLFGHCGFGAREDRGHDRGESGFEELEGGGGFGIRRPLRFLAHRLGLDEQQVASLARILDELKIERAQSEVDHRRTVAAFADAVASEPFDAAKAAEGGELRVKSAERLRSAVVKALQEIHAVLNAEQRARLALLIRTGTLRI
jgi:Spy/CpxP family protein refolding chaperone